MSFSENKGIWWTLATLVALVGLIAWFVLSSHPFSLVILFDRVGGLKKDDPVTWREFIKFSVKDRLFSMPFWLQPFSPL